MGIHSLSYFVYHTSYFIIPEMERRRDEEGEGGGEEEEKRP